MTDSRKSNEQDHPSVSQADGTGGDAPRGETQAQPKSQTPNSDEERKQSEGAPDQEAAKMPANTTRDSAGEVGEPTGRGTLDAPREPGTHDEASESSSENLKDRPSQRKDPEAA